MSSTLESTPTPITEPKPMLSLTDAAVAKVKFFAHGRSYEGEVPLVTVDIGANDVDGCADVPVSQDLVHGHPGRALAGLSARADLVVLGRRSAHHGPGSVMHAVLSHAHGPVVTVPS